MIWRPNSSLSMGLFHCKAAFLGFGKGDLTIHSWKIPGLNGGFNEKNHEPSSVAGSQSMFIRVWSYVLNLSLLCIPRIGW